MPILQNKRPTKLSNKCWKKHLKFSLLVTRRPSQCAQGETPDLLVKVLSIALLVKSRYGERELSWNLGPWCRSEGLWGDQEKEPHASVSVCQEQRTIGHWGKAGAQNLPLVRPTKSGSERAPSSHTKASIRHGICQTKPFTPASLLEMGKCTQQLGRQNYVREREQNLNFILVSSALLAGNHVTECLKSNI